MPLHAEAALLDTSSLPWSIFGLLEFMLLALAVGIFCFAATAAVVLVRVRSAAAARQLLAQHEIERLRARNERVGALLQLEPNILVVWGARAEEPEIIGDVTLVVGAGGAADAVLPFDSWLDLEQSRLLTRSVDCLRSAGESFLTLLTTRAGRPIEASGRAIGGHAVLRLRDVSGMQRELADLLAQQAALAGECHLLHALIDALPAPAWMRDPAGRLKSVNRAYARAVSAATGEEAVARGLELIEPEGCTDIIRARAAHMPYAGRLRAVCAGAHRNFDVVEVTLQEGNAGVAFDASEAEALRTELARVVQAHRRTLDRLATGVATFDAEQRLIFYNTAYAALWGLDPAFLDPGPTDSAILDRLRGAGKLPEQQDFRRWKAQLHEAYRADGAVESFWHLPDGRTLRVVTTPNPEGGVTYLYEDVTERLILERRFDALIRVQRETLDNLGEAVALFGSDGRIRLFNPAFVRMWKLSPAALAERPHIETVTAWCKPLQNEYSAWSALRAAVTGLDEREAIAGRIERCDGSIVNCSTVPLPDGATLVTFQDVTDSVNVERALRERNEALETADRIKIDFVHNLSYELRSPLTNIIGFAHFLSDPSTGRLNERQLEYLGYINASTNALLAIVNNILDLATIDAGAMTLSLGAVDIRRAIETAAEGVQDRLVRNGIRLHIRAAADIGSFVADERRLRQILFNLLANAVSFSPPGETVTLAAERRVDAIVFAVADRGPGISGEAEAEIWDRPGTHPFGSPHRATSLGLSLVRSFVKLHGGTVRLEASGGRGTTVMCIFPIDPVVVRDAAE